MRLFVLLFLFSFIELQAQGIEVARFSETQPSDIKDFQFYLIDNEDFNDLLQLGDADFKLIYTYAAWCKPCIETLPKVLSFHKTYEDQIDLYIITPEHEENLKQFNLIRNNLIKAGFQGPIFNISNTYSKRYKKKYISFVESISEEIQDYGLSLILFFGEENNLLVSSTYLNDKEVYINQIQQILDSN